MVIFDKLEHQLQNYHIDKAEFFKNIYRGKPEIQTHNINLHLLGRNSDLIQEAISYISIKNKIELLIKNKAYWEHFLTIQFQNRRIKINSNIEGLEMYLVVIGTIASFFLNNIIKGFLDNQSFIPQPLTKYFFSFTYLAINILLFTTTAIIANLTAQSKAKQGENLLSKIPDNPFLNILKNILEISEQHAHTITIKQTPLHQKAFDSNNFENANADDSLSIVNL